MKVSPQTSPRHPSCESPNSVPYGSPPDERDLMGGFRVGRPPLPGFAESFQLRQPISKDTARRAAELVSEGCDLARRIENLGKDDERRPQWREKAFRALSAAQQTDPENCETNWALGHMYWIKNDFANALRFADRARERLRDRVGIKDVYDLYLLIYKSLGDQEKVQQIRNEREADAVDTGELTEDMTSTFLNRF